MAGRNKYNVCSERSITIHKTPGDLYQAWRKPGIILNCIPDAQAVDVLDDKHARWIVDIPDKGFSSWESEITGDQENRAITWHAKGGAGYGHEGSVRFTPAPNGLGTEVELVVCRHLFGGRVTNAIARLVGRSPEDYISRVLHNFKQLMETGEVATNMGPSGRDAGAEAVERGGGAS
ncbi:MAG TPA: SRPBCC family protein [Deltaproteobacteria bacterium]|jgi:uncharacterized membrane protein|nr:SRPBCC family protein [Deltaproteobacteria bacterium]HOI06004.1 SRPBCC family protein [Deltaproteobacteria bacterium]